ncbi:MAG: aminoglycoside phosphotransferase family protein [Rhodospirillales bacterium]|nr:aminoglycoside phosphotransferase family protein [Rhodospirillales bacterium]
MDVNHICALLGQDGIDVHPETIKIEARDDRWAVHLPGDRMAWVPMNARGAARLSRERRILELLSIRCIFRIPSILHVAESGWDLRTMVPGDCNPWGLYQRIQGDRALARRIGRSLGEILTQQHSLINVEDTAGWLPSKLSWPEPWLLIKSQLPDVVDDLGLLREIDRLIESCRIEDDCKSTDNVLVHGDLGLHNIVVEPGTGRVKGIFDYDGAAWVDRHYDFRYFVFDRQEDDLLDSALEVYEGDLGIQLDRRRIWQLNAACAVGFLAYRRGTPPEAQSCGRTLAEDIGWVRYALSKVR